MQFLAWIITAANIYSGAYFFLNFIHVLRSSKYSQMANLQFGLLFLCMGASSIYILLSARPVKLALLIGLGPWILALAFLFINLITGDYK